jgi:hypothetical protein
MRLKLHEIFPLFLFSQLYPQCSGGSGRFTPFWYHPLYRLEEKKKMLEGRISKQQAIQARNQETSQTSILWNHQFYPKRIIVFIQGIYKYIKERIQNYQEFEEGRQVR